MKKLLKNSINIENFEEYIKNNNFLNIVYLDKDKIQTTYKDITGKVVLFDLNNNTTSSSKLGLNLGVINLEINSGKENESKNYYTPKELILKLVNDKIYQSSLSFFKVRLSELNRNDKVNDVVISQTKPVLAIMKKCTPRTVEGRKKMDINFFENHFLYLKENFTYGVINDFLFDEKSFFTNPKPDIEQDDFYMICLSNSFSNLRELSLSGNNQSFLLIEPLVLIRDI